MSNYLVMSMYSMHESKLVNYICFFMWLYVSIDTYTCLQYRREENSTREQRIDETPKGLMKRSFRKPDKMLS